MGPGPQPAKQNTHRTRKKKTPRRGRAAPFSGSSCFVTEAKHTNQLGRRKKAKKQQLKAFACFPDHPRQQKKTPPESQSQSDSDLVVPCPCDVSDPSLGQVPALVVHLEEPHLHPGRCEHRHLEFSLFFLFRGGGGGGGAGGGGKEPGKGCMKKEGDKRHTLFRLGCCVVLCACMHVRLRIGGCCTFYLSGGNGQFHWPPSSSPSLETLARRAPTFAPLYNLKTGDCVHRAPRAHTYLSHTRQR